MTPLSGSQIYKLDESPPTTHQICNFFTLWHPDGVASGSQLTNRM